MTISPENKKEEDGVLDNYHGEHMIKIVSTYKEKGELDESFSDLSDMSTKKQKKQTNILNNLEMGHTMRANTALGKYEMVVPKYTMNVENGIKNRVFLQVQGTLIDGLKSPYWSALKDEVFIRDLHRVINGRIEVWRMGVIKLCEELDLKGDVPKKQYIKQMEYAMNSVPLMQNSIDKFTIFALPILNHTALIQMLHGVETQEDADLIYNISNHEDIKIRALYDDKKRKASIVTIFDDDPNIKTYGKKDKAMMKTVTKYHY